MTQTLTPRENEILKMITLELSSCEIAARLELSIRTVETHRKNIYQKTHTNNLVGLIKYSIRAGIMDGFSFDDPATLAEPRPVLQLQQMA